MGSQDPLISFQPPESRKIALADDLEGQGGVAYAPPELSDPAMTRTRPADMRDA